MQSVLAPTWGRAGLQPTSVAATALPPACVTFTDGAVPMPLVASEARATMVTVVTPAGLGDTDSTLRLGATVSRVTAVVTSAWFTAGAPSPAQHQLPEPSRYSAAT